MALNARLTRVLRGVRRWRGHDADTPIPVDPDLPEGDWRHIAGEIDAAVETKGGPVAARRRARTIGLTYDSLSATGRLRFLQKLATEYGREDDVVDEAMDAVFHAATPAERRKAEADLRAKLRPRREVLLRRMAGQEGGLPFLIDLRADLLPHRRTAPALAALDADVHQILENWFDVGLLRLERLTWDTPASFLEKLIEYEAVHAIESWDDLKRRLGPGRRCYAFVHPGMPNDPLIFVEVALTKDIARELGPLLQRSEAARSATVPAAGDIDEDDFDTAIFYSISNCHSGLAGVSLGDFLIKSVAVELASELNGLRAFATLSPIPGFRDWLQAGLEDVSGGDPIIRLTKVDGPNKAQQESELRAELLEVLGGDHRRPDDPVLDGLKPILLELVARYLLEVLPSGRAVDPVAHFHLSNGAQVDRVNWMANPSPVGWERGLGMMVNYRYELKEIERNHDRYVNEQQITASDSVKKLMDGGRS